ncbi:alpha/beta fold hydrolase [Pelagibacterium montanilacus]|uniref:alpha/beta fold hydrolase n=1 Tax=Pelagibacterium montanilacus TaxID=2185280 RepID=UPI000F8F429D|nr:alpha/beta fold hydrolase [Pelagibacterium montanilacus]
MSQPSALLHRLGGDLSARPVLFIHGFGADRFGWAANAPALFETANVFALDLPGHGAAPSEVGTGAIADLVEAAYEALDPAIEGSWLLVGHSLGGAVTLGLAARVPDRVGSVVAIAPAGYGTGIDEKFVDCLPRLESEDETEALLQTLVSRPRLINRQMAAHVLNGLETPGRREALSRIGDQLKTLRAPALPDCPVLWIWGTDDSINPPSSDFAARSGDSYELIEGARHMPHVEYASKVNRLLVSAAGSD